MRSGGEVRGKVRCEVRCEARDKARNHVRSEVRFWVMSVLRSVVLAHRGRVTGFGERGCAVCSVQCAAPPCRR